MAERTTVLVVDDNDMMRKLLTAELSQDVRLHVESAATAAEGLAFKARFNSVGADYFATVGLPILRGRAFSAGEATRSEGMADAVIDGEKPLAGRRCPRSASSIRRGQRPPRERRRRR